MTIELTPALDREYQLVKLRTWAREYHQPPGFIVGAIDEGVVTSNLLRGFRRRRSDHETALMFPTV